MKQKRILAAVLLAATPLAQAATNSLGEVVVTATRTEQPLVQTLSHTTVITRADIKASQAADVPTLLRTLAGVEVYQSGGIGKQSSLFLRGANSSHTLVLVDGVRIGSATSGTSQIDQLMLDQIDRIEVVRGNVSSLYGSEAIGGVIQIFTRRGAGAPAFNSSIGEGSNRTWRISAGYGGKTANNDFNVELSRNSSDGVSAISTGIVPGVNPDKDGYANKSVSASLRHAFGKANSLSASVYDSKGTSQNDNAYGAATDVNSSRSHVQELSAVLANHFGDGWLSKLQLSRGIDDTLNYLNGAPDLQLGAQFRTTSNQLSWQNTLSIGSSNVLVLGWERLKQQVASSTQFTRTNRTDDSLFAGYTVNVGNKGNEQWQLNYRKDRYSDFGTARTWLLGYGVDIAPLWRVTASMATAFKAPTLNDLFYPFTDYGAGFSYVGNPNLKPEHSRDRELGFHFANDRQHLDLVYFDNRIFDLIVNDNLPAGSTVNLNEARIDGEELSYSEQAGNTMLKLATTWQNPRDVATGQTLLRRAKRYSTLSITRQYGVVKLGGEWQYSGARADIDINTYARTTLAPYDIVNFTASYPLDPHMDLAVRVDNAFNRDYMLAHGYNTPGRTIFVGLNYR